MKNINKTEVNGDKTQGTSKSVVVKHRSVISLGFSVMGQTLLGYVLCLFFFSVTALINNLPIAIITQILQIIIIFSLPYNAMWYEGDRDRNLVKYNRINHDLFRGLKVGVVSALPAFLAYGFLLLAYFFKNQTLYVIYRVFNFPFTNIIMWVTGYTPNNVAFLSDLRWYHTIILLLIPVVLILPSALGYGFGYNKISISSIQEFKGRQKKQKSEEVK